MGIYNGPEGDDPYPSWWYERRDREEEEAKKKQEFLKLNPDWKPAWKPDKIYYAILKRLEELGEELPDWAKEEIKRTEAAFPGYWVPGIAEMWQFNMPSKPRPIDRNSGLKVSLKSFSDYAYSKDELLAVMPRIKNKVDFEDVEENYVGFGEKPWLP